MGQTDEQHASGGERGAAHLPVQRVYLDHNGSTPVTPAVSREVRAFMEGYWGNAGAGHPDGRAAAMAIEVARERVADAIGGASDEVTFTSGGTESNNWAIRGMVDAAPSGRRHVVCGRHEHPSVLRTVESLERTGLEVTWLDPGRDGALASSDLAAAVRGDTLLVILMIANNETGALQPVRDAASLAHEHGALLFVDAVCGTGKIPVDVRTIGGDLLSLSGHKLHAPKGIGALWVRRGVSIAPLIHGCGQQGGRRSGTENTLGAVGLGAAMAANASNATVGEAVRPLRDRLHRELERLGAGIERNGAEPGLGNTLSLWFPGYDALWLQERLGDLGLSVSAQAWRVPAEGGPGAVRPSHVLMAMGHGETRATQSLRFSLGSTTTPQEIDVALDIVRQALHAAPDPTPVPHVLLPTSDRP